MKHNDISLEENLNMLYHAMQDSGYDPAVQFSNFILSEDPTYIPDCDNARGIIRRMDRDEILRFFIRSYFEKTV